MANASDELESIYFTNALKLFFEYQWLYNTAVTEILTKESLDAIPKEWQSAMVILENQDLNDFVVKKKIKSEWCNSLKAFVEKCRNTDRLPATKMMSPIKLPPQFKTGLTYKKRHEIEQLAHLVHKQCLRQGIKVVVDFGAGLGYVSQLLYHLYGYRVLGLEKNQAMVDKAKFRQQKMYPTSMSCVKYACYDLTSDSTDKIQSILDHELPGSTDACLIGLHACGDLSIYATRIFSDMKAARIFIMMPCCFHKLSISRDIKSDVSNEKQYFHHFPVSSRLRSVIGQLGVDIGSFLRQPFLRLACQEPADRWDNMSDEAHNEHSFHVLARAVLELYATQNDLILQKRVQKGTRKSQCLNFESYVKDSLLRYTLVTRKKSGIQETCDAETLEIHKKNITELWKRQCDKLRIAEIYSGLQLLLQAPAESLVLEDRLCWMREQGLAATIIPVTNNRVSPRSYAIVSQKT